MSATIHPTETITTASIFHPVNGGVTAAQGFKAAGDFVGIKKAKKDLALIVSDCPAVAAACLTTNVVKAAPILWCLAVIDGGQPVKGIVVNSGNANACTGELGVLHTEQMAQATAKHLGCQPEEILVASTGVIGVPLPIETIVRGIQTVSAQIEDSPEAGHLAAEAIMTTDTFPKETAVTVEIGGKTVTIGGMAKGSGMIHPNMATMLAFITTDAAISAEMLQKALKDSTEDSYNMISVDGDTSTNDMVSVLANGLAGNPLIDSEDEDYALFKQALNHVNQTLAQAIARDGEGATKFLSAHVKNAASKTVARTLAKSIISSSLVKSAFYGEDANWGRILAAMGYAGVEFDPAKVDLSLVSPAGCIEMLKAGQPVPFDESIAKAILQEKDIDIQVDLHAGTAGATAWGCDLSHDYVSINASYRT
jgi:glutamate N-acetyltransferase/amino-acid N-acetyltransferase